MKMKTSYYVGGLAWIFGLILCSSVQTACSSSDDDETTNGRKQRRLVVSDVSITRATLTDNTNTISAIWTEGDAATFFNVSSYTSDNMDYSNLTASSSASTSIFTGTVKCYKLDNIALWYPAANPITTAGSDRGKYFIKLYGQKGTLSDIATNFHFIYGTGTITSVTENTANASISSMKSLLAVWRLSFTDKEDDTPIPVNTLSIRYDDADGYPLRGKITPSADMESVAVEADSPTGPLTINVDGASEVYVALFPSPSETKQKLHFTVTNDGGTYTGTASVALKAGNFYKTPLKLTKQ